MPSEMVARISRFGELLLTLVQKELKAKYKNTSLGYFWSLALPLLQAIVFYAVFKLILRIPTEDYPLFLICGLFAWQWTANSVTGGPQSFLGNASLIKKLRFDHSVLPLSGVCVDMIHFLFTLPVTIAALLLYGKAPAWSWIPGIPLHLLLQGMFVYAAALLLATVNVFFRDTERVVGIFLMVVFYLTPVVYPLSMAPERYQWLFYLNPVAIHIESWRMLMLTGEMNIQLLTLSAVYGTTMLWFSMRVFRKARWRFAEVL